MADSAISAMRRCTRCGLEKPATTDHFAPHKIGKFGLRSHCRPCRKEYDAAMRERPDQLQRQQKWRDANKGVVRKHNEKWRAANKSTAHVAAWRKRNIDHARARDAERNRNRRKTDPAYRLKCRMSARLSMMAKGKGGKSSFELLGYSPEQLCRHLERQFLPGMTWDNIGEWHIDHIIPVSAFNIHSPDDPDFRVCWGLANLRPLWRRDNQVKGGKVLTLL